MKPTGDSSYPQPDLDQLMRVVETIEGCPDYREVRLVVAAPSGDYQFLEVTDEQELRNSLEGLLEDGYLALGMLAMEQENRQARVRKLLFRWHRDPNLKELFDRLCEVGASSFT